MIDPHPLVKRLIKARKAAGVSNFAIQKKLDRAGYRGRWREYEGGRSKLPNILLLDRVGALFDLRLVWARKGSGTHKRTVEACAGAMCRMCHQGFSKVVEKDGRFVHVRFGADLNCGADKIWRMMR